MAPVVALALIVVAAFAVEATVGFGATLVTLALGSLVMPTDAVLYRVVPLNLLLSASLAARGRHAIDARALFARMLPAMVAGMPVGLLVLHEVTPRQLQRLLAALVLALAAVELLALTRATAARAGPDASLPPRPLSRAAGLALLILGGVAHGALASGGPPVVYVAARTMKDKAVFRATLSALWLLLNVVLVALYALGGRVTAATLRDSVPLLPAVAVGLALGDVVHARVSEASFKRLVFGLLVIVAGVLAARA